MQPTSKWCCRRWFWNFSYPLKRTTHNSTFVCLFIELTNWSKKKKNIVELNKDVCVCFFFVELLMNCKAIDVLWFEINLRSNDSTLSNEYFHRTGKINETKIHRRKWYTFFPLSVSLFLSLYNFFFHSISTECRTLISIQKSQILNILFFIVLYRCLHVYPCVLGRLE